MQNSYYVYVYLDIRKPGHYIFGDLVFAFEPFYVGKGTKKRYQEHLNEAYNNTGRGKNPHKCNTIRKIKKETGQDPKIIFLYENLTPTQAVKHEIQTIDCVGRHNIGSGPLTNITRGGQGGCGPHSKVTRKKMSKAQKGKPKTNEHIEAMKRANASKRKRWVLTTPTGKDVVVDRLQDFCDQHDLVYREMLKISQRNDKNKHIHRAKRHRGWSCQKIT